MQHRNGILTALILANAFLLLPGLGFAQGNGNGRDNGLPPGVQNNPGLSGNGQGDTQGNHYGWYKHQNDGDSQSTGNNPSPNGGPQDGQFGQAPPPGMREGMEQRRQEREAYMKEHPEMREQMEQRRQQREEYMKNHPEAKEAMEKRREERQAYMQSHPEMREQMEQRRQERQEFMKNHPEAREAMQQRHSGGFQSDSEGSHEGNHDGNEGWHGNSGQGHGQNGSIPGNAYGNGQVRGNGGQMGNSHSPHHNN